MSARTVTADKLILAFLRAVGEAPIHRIIRYMETRPLDYPAGTTRNRLVALVSAGSVRRVGYGRYQGSQPMGSA